MQTCETCKHYQPADAFITRKDKLDFARCGVHPKIDEAKLNRLNRVGKYEEEVLNMFCVDVRAFDTCEEYEVDNER